MEMDIKIKIANTEEITIIKNLYGYYLHDLSAFTDSIETDETGSFLWDSEEMYRTNNSLHPIIVLYKEKPIGFILLSEQPYVKKGCNYCIQEFFLLNQYRGKGKGSLVIKELFKLYPGMYCLLILEKNQKAKKFWNRLFDTNNINHEEGFIEQGQDRCIYQTFVV